MLTKGWLLFVVVALVALRSGNLELSGRLEFIGEILRGAKAPLSFLPPLEKGD